MLTIALNYASSEQMSLLKQKEVQQNRILAFLKNQCKLSTVFPIESRGVLLQFQIPVVVKSDHGGVGASTAVSSDSVDVSLIFDKLENERIMRGTDRAESSVDSNLPIREWSIAKTTLDEVFLRIVTEDAEENQLRIT
ncbi:unnamed protein product [Amoebophrya sp. A120]|nr:unnamed protein product [Amoebophrya sp. A120]|eukprot:GSA120T00019944001.1